MKLATVISYCTNDNRFIDRCIKEASQFSSQVIVVSCDHFFDGTPENRLLLDNTYARHPQCEFIEMCYLTDRLYSRYHPILPDDPDWAAYWIATTRYAGFHYVKSEIDWILFLDSDEIFEADGFLEWINQGGVSSYEMLRLGAYLYATCPTLRAVKYVSLSLLVQKQTLAPLTLLTPLDRIGAYQRHLGPKRERVLGVSNRPFIHHYSWVRTKEECKHKARTWSHRHEQDWMARIEEAFSGNPERLFEFITEFKKIDAPYFDPFAASFQADTGIHRQNLPNVRKINDKDLFLQGLNLLT